MSTNTNSDKYLCFNCGKEAYINQAQWKCNCGGLLMIKKGQLDFKNCFENKKLVPGMWKYERMTTSVPLERIITLGEGNTPHTEAVWDNRTVFLKWEGLMPTGSYKDRGASAMVSMLKQLGIEEIVEDSSGNAGAAIAWYAKMANIHCHIYVPENASGGKLNTIIASGAKLFKIEGPRENATLAALEAAKEVFYASHVWCPFFIEGIKSISYEIFEYFAERMPQRMVLPLGNGSLLLGVYKGLEELKMAGLITELPQIIAVQSSNCSPIYDSFHEINRELIVGHTIAEGIANAVPARKDEIINVIKATKGTVLSVSESEIIIALEKSLKKGWMIEPTSATALAGFSQLKEDLITLIIVSGSGLKINQQLAEFVSKQ